MASLALIVGLPLLALLAGWYKFQAWRWELPALGLGLALLVWLFERAVARLAPAHAPALVWGSLLGGAAWGLLLTLLSPFSGLTWVLVAPFHHEALFVALALMGAASLLRGPWAGRWPRPTGEQSLPRAWRLLAFLGLCGLVLLAALHVGLHASLLEDPGQAAPGGLKGLAKSPTAVLWLLGLGAFGLAALLALQPGRALTQWLPGLCFGLLWARLGIGALSAMEPVQRAFSAEILQLLYLAAAAWLGLRLARAPGIP